MGIIGFFVVQIAVIALAVIAGALIFGFVWLYTRHTSQGRARALILGFLFPAFIIFYLEGAWFTYGLIEDLQGRDSFLEGIYHYPLVDSYTLVAVSKFPEEAWIEPDKHPGVRVSDVRQFQVFQKTLLVTSHKDLSGTDWGADKLADQYQIVDTTTGAVTNYDSMGQFLAAAGSRGIPMHLTNVDDAMSIAFNKAQPGWLFYIFVSIPVFAAIIWYGFQLRRLRQSAQI